MGLKMESGGRRGQACGYPVVIPRCGPASPFRGHLSTKSNAFCIDSCRNLTGQYLIRDHMVVHYNRILSAKAAVDCSVPKSRLTSIKFVDQQRREKLKKKMPRYEEKMNTCECGSRSCSRDCGRLPSCFRKSFLEVEDNLCPCAGKAPCLSREPSPFDKHGVVHSSQVKHARKCSRNTSRASHSGACTSRPPSKRSGLSYSHSVDSFVNVGCSHKCQAKNPRASSGDLLEKHSEYFTKSRKPFTPRTLVSNAKSLLTEYRYYTPARRKKNRRKRHVEAQTQTDMISFPSADKKYVKKVMCGHRKIPSQAEAERCTPDEPEREIDDCQCSILRETSQHPRKCSPGRTVESEEEELLYLTFIEDVTNEILRLGIFSNRVLDQLFECYIEENKDRLDEGKMREMLDVLKSDLGCSQDSDSELIHEDQDSDTELIHEGQDSDTELIHEGQCSETELSQAHQCSETELSQAIQGIKTELSQAGLDCKTKLVHASLDSEAELSRTGLDNKTKLVHASLDSEAELSRRGLDNKTKLIHASLDSEAELSRRGLDNKTKLIHASLDSEAELSRTGLDCKTKLVHASLDSEAELSRTGLDNKTKLVHSGLDSGTVLGQAGLDSKSKLIHACQDSEVELSQEASESLDLQECDTMEELQFTSKGHRLRKATTSEEYPETLKLSLQEPNICESLSFSERSRETQSREEFSEDTTGMMDAWTESDYCGVELEEHPDSSPTCETSLNLIACDSDLEVSEELDELEENLADTLHISRNYS